MGLDISAYSKITPDPHETPDGWCDRYEEDDGGWHRQPFVYSAHVASGRGLSVDREVVVRGQRFLVGPCVRAGGDEIGFRAGSYTGYNNWRHELCMAALGKGPLVVWNHPEDYLDSPFYELIHFADNEGCIGPEAAADLSTDFQMYRHTVRPLLHAKFERYGQTYDDFAQAFELAAGTGVVIFH